MGLTWTIILFPSFFFQKNKNFWDLKKCFLKILDFSNKNYEVLVAYILSALPPMWSKKVKNIFGLALFILILS